MKDLLANLNPEQKEAVLYDGRALLIFAGAGSGKTRVLTHKIARLVRDKDVHPSQILAVTFTNKASQEMKQRIFNLFGHSSKVPSWVSTFHSFCSRVLRKHAELLDYKSNFAIYDSSDSISSLKRVYKRLKIDPKFIEPRTVLSHIDKAKNSYESPEDLQKRLSLPRDIASTIVQLYTEYQKELFSSNAMDFGDLLTNTVTLFSLEGSLLKRYQEQFKHILVDEYQDTNRVQYLLFRQLSGGDSNVCVVGDDDQSIYAFRGASIKNILSFHDDFPDAHVITLDTNYRSSKNILDVANAVIKHNKSRRPKKMKTENPHGSPIYTYRGYDEKDEARFVTREIAYQIESGTSLKDIAIFYRTNAQSRVLEEALIQTNINYKIFGSLRFYERKEVKDTLAYLRLAINPRDNESFLRVINVPTRGIGQTSVGGLIAYAQKENYPLLEALTKALSDGGSFLTRSNTSKFSSFVALIQKIQSQAEKVEDSFVNSTTSSLENGDVSPEDIHFERKEEIYNLIKGIADNSGYIAKLKKDGSPEAEARLENIMELCAVSVDYVVSSYSEGKVPSLIEFLERSSLTSDLDKGHNEMSKDNYISLMTLHLAKGLEFDCVFLTGLEEGILPHVRSLDNLSELEEERRLCYVGLTRAKKTLHLSRATFRQAYRMSHWYNGEASQFVFDMPWECIEEKNSGFI